MQGNTQFPQKRYLEHPGTCYPQLAIHEARALPKRRGTRYAILGPSDGTMKTAFQKSENTMLNRNRGIDFQCICGEVERGDGMRDGTQVI